VGELGNESGMTPLHLASYSGNENVVRLLLNSAGVQVEAATTENVHTVIYILHKFSEFVDMQYAVSYSSSWSNWLSNSWYIIPILLMLAS
jgi:ankyrin repeat protein